MVFYQIYTQLYKMTFHQYIHDFCKSRILRSKHFRPHNNLAITKVKCLLHTQTLHSASVVSAVTALYYYIQKKINALANYFSF